MFYDIVHYLFENYASLGYVDLLDVDIFYYQSLWKLDCLLGREKNGEIK